jgi:hypothetical protein
VSGRGASRGTPCRATRGSASDAATLEIVECDAGCSSGQGVAGRWSLSTDGQIATFEPEIRLKYGRTYELRVRGVRDERDNPMSDDVVSRFTTFVPRVLGGISGVNARDVVPAER